MTSIAILIKRLGTLVCVSPSQCWFGYYSGLSVSTLGRERAHHSTNKSVRSKSQVFSRKFKRNTVCFNDLWRVLFSLIRSRFCLITQRSSPTNGCAHSNHIPFPIWANHSYGSIFWTCIAPKNLFRCRPIIACVLQHHVWWQVVSQEAVFILVSSRTLVFVMNKTDLKLLRFDSLFRVGIETDVHKTRMLYLTLSAILDKINEKPRPVFRPKSRMRKWRFFALRAASSLIWGGWGFAVPFSKFVVCV